MALSRYQFELLKLLEEKGIVENSVRELSNTILMSGAAFEKSLEEADKEGWVEQSDNKLKITDKGLEALEPYRVKKAIVLAAGFGSRMMPATADRPKPLVTVNGVRIIDTVIDAMVAVGIKDITIVRGYKKERFAELQAKYPFVKLIDNDIYDKTNNISSMIAALDEFTGCYLCEADLYITNPKVITKYQYCSNILGSYSLETDDWCFDLDEGHICNYKKGGTYCFNYYGISYWTPEDCEKLREDYVEVYEHEEGGNDVFWEFIPLIKRRDKYQVEVRPCNKSDIMEIDNYFELQYLDPSYK